MLSILCNKEPVYSTKKQKAICFVLFHAMEISSPHGCVSSSIYRLFIIKAFLMSLQKRTHQECAKSLKREAKTPTSGLFANCCTAIEGSFTSTWFKLMYCVHFKPLNKISVSRKMNCSSTRL